MALSEEIVAVNDLVSKLDYQWYQEKMSLFQTIYIVKKQDIADWNLPEDFLDYCLYSSIKEKSDSPLEKTRMQIFNLTHDGSDIAYEIYRSIETKVKRYTDVNAIKNVIDLTIQEIEKSVVTLKSGNNDNQFHVVLDRFLTNALTLITEKYSHINEQFQILMEASPLQPALTVEICERIANFKIKDVLFVTAFKGASSKGEALYHLLTEDAPTNGLAVWAEDWKPSWTHYLLYILMSKTSNCLRVVDIEKKKAFYVQKGTLFPRGAYDNFKSERLASFEKKLEAKLILEQIKASL